MQCRNEPTLSSPRMATSLARRRPQFAVPNCKIRPYVPVIWVLDISLPAFVAIPVHNCSFLQRTYFIFFTGHQGIQPFACTRSPLSFLFFRLAEGSCMQHVSLSKGISTVSAIIFRGFRLSIETITSAIHSSRRLSDSWKRGLWQY